MPRGISIAILALLALTACGPREPMLLMKQAKLSAPAPEVRMASDEDAAPSQAFSYSHMMSLFMGHDAVKARYDAARERCLRDAALRCKLLSANFDEEVDGSAAHVVVALPHDAVAGFEAALLKAVPRDKDKVELRSRSTEAQSVENEKNDTDKKVAQLSKYRDGLATLAKRPNLSVDDFIKVQQELSKTEADLDEALSANRDVTERIARERLSVDLYERGKTASPLGAVWDQAGDLFAGSTATMLSFVIVLLPWLPIGIALFFLLRLVWRVARRRKAVAKSA
jgi:predicted small lipoprotein YifL